MLPELRLVTSIGNYDGGNGNNGGGNNKVNRVMKLKSPVADITIPTDTVPQQTSAIIDNLTISLENLSSSVLLYGIVNLTILNTDDSGSKYTGPLNLIISRMIEGGNKFTTIYTVPLPSIFVEAATPPRGDNPVGEDGDNTFYIPFEYLDNPEIVSLSDSITYKFSMSIPNVGKFGDTLKASIMTSQIYSLTAVEILQ